jgi:uncharacterized membrane protein YbhN (UPF0104 family)
VTRRALLVLVVLAITVVFTVVAVRGAHPREVWEAVRDSRPLWLVPSLLTLAVGVWLRAVRWRVLFAPATRPALWPTTAATLVGYLFTQILPFRAGEAARLVALNQRAGTSRAEIAGTVVIERVYDLVSVLLLLFVLLPWLPEVTWLQTAAVVGAVLLVVVVAAAASLVIWGERPVQALVRPLGRLPFVPAEPLEEIGRNLARGLAGLHQPGVAAAAFALSVVSWLVLGVSTWFVFVAFDLGVSFVAGTFVMIVTALAAVIPAGPAGIGVFEAAAVVALRAYGIDDSTALSVALVLHGVTSLAFVVAGLAVLRFHLRAPLRRVQEPAARAEN